MSLGTFANPLDDPEVWDVAVIAQVEVPGLSKIKGASRKFKWDEKEGPGASGATHTYRGDRPAHFSLIVHLWEPEHFDEWADLAPLLVPDPKRGIRALDIYHPALESLGISAVVVEELGQPENDGKGLWTIEVKLSEYKPAPKATASGTPSGAASGKGKTGANGSANAPPTAKTEQEKEIERLLAEARKP